ncbi:MAG: LptF/LptG family permease [Bacteroidetes bacterium]|nr:LptF/LptG family permease [Bacteroidota bacterium]
MTVKRVHFLVIKSWIGPLVATFCISLFLLLMQFLWKYIDDLVGKGLEFSVISELLLYAIAGLVPMALPLSILLASLMAFGNLGEHYELISLKSAGISLSRIMYPLIILTFIISIGAFFFSNNVLPFINLKMGSLLFDVRNKRPDVSIKEGIFYNGIDGYSIKVGRKNKSTGQLYNIMVYDHSSRMGNLDVTLADSGRMEVTKDKRNLILSLYHGKTYTEVHEDKRRKTKESHPHRQDKFSEQKVILDLSGYGLKRTDENLFKNNYQMLNLKQLSVAGDSLKKAYFEYKNQFSRNLLRTNLFRKELKNDTNIIRNYDSINSTISFDSVFNAMLPGEKARVIDQALNYARTTKSYISSSKNDFVHKKKWINRHEIEWHRKFTLSFACFILFFIGAPLGAIIRKGGLGMPVVISVVFFVLYYVVSMTGEKYVKSAVMPAWEGMWVSSAILLPLGMFLTYKAANDSVILNFDSYTDVIRKFFTSMKKKK